jgi:hypothetical protein
VLRQHGKRLQILHLYLTANRFTRWQWYYNKTQHTNNTHHTKITHIIKNNTTIKRNTVHTMNTLHRMKIQQLQLQYAKINTLHSYNNMKMKNKVCDFLIRILEPGDRLVPPGTSVINWPIIHALGDYEDREFCGMMTGRGARSTRRKPCPSAILSATNPTWPDLARTRVTVMGSQRLTVWFMARTIVIV